MSKLIKSIIKKFLPRILLKYYRLIYYFLIQNKFKGMNNKEIFSMIYRKNMWGESKQKKKFDSGFGSRNNKIIDGFISNVNNFIINLNYKPTILDIGCGDFNVGKNIFLNSEKYIACDVVPDLIEYNKKIYKNPKIEFLTLDACEAKKLPKANIVILRQVLQHLSNQKIKSILEKIKYDYDYLIVCEHLPLENYKPNIDIKTGDLSRLFIGSGVNIEKNPFNYKFTSKKIINEVVEKEGKLITTIYKK